MLSSPILARLHHGAVFGVVILLGLALREPFVFGAPCFGHMRVETAGLLLRSLLTFGPVRLARGLLFGLRHRAVLAQGSRRLNASCVAGLSKGMAATDERNACAALLWRLRPVHQLRRSH
jgi:hypothetical protein